MSTDIFDKIKNGESNWYNVDIQRVDKFSIRKTFKTCMFMKTEMVDDGNTKRLLLSTKATTIV